MKHKLHNLVTYAARNSHARFDSANFSRVRIFTVLTHPNQNWQIHQDEDELVEAVTAKPEQTEAQRLQYQFDSRVFQGDCE